MTEEIDDLFRRDYGKEADAFAAQLNNAAG